MGAPARGGAGVASGFVAGLLIGITAVVIVAPPPSAVVVTQTSGNLQSLSAGNSTATTNIALNSLRGQQDGALANTGVCASALALEQSQRSILEANIAAVENDLRTLRENRGCDAECKHVDDPVAVMRPQPQSNPLFVRGTIPPSPSQQDGSLTVAAHLTSDRLSSLDQLCRLYPGRIAASVYVPKRNLSTLAQWCDADRSCMCGDPTKSRITLKYSLHDGLTRAFGQLYPVNSLRNQALMAVNTEFTLGLDADFVVGGPADAIPRPPPYTVYVLPCFKVDDDSLRSGDASIQYPLTKKALLKWWKQDRRVAAYNDPGWPLGHADVDYDRWANATEKYRIDRANIYFEPYFVARTGDLPLYDERYRGYGAGDKALHFHLLYKMGYTVEVLPNHFVLHLPHADNDWRGSPQRGTREQALRNLYIGFHGVERMSMGVHQIDFWTRVVGNCAPQGCRRSYCSPLVPELSGGEARCKTRPERYFDFPALSP